MNKGIYLDNRTGKWYISAKIRVGSTFKNCTIRGYNSKREADNDYQRAIADWKKQHNFNVGEGTFSDVFLEYCSYREQQVTHETARRDVTQYNTYWKSVYENDVLENVFDRQRLNIVYKNLMSETKYNSKKKYELVKSFKNFARYCYEHHLISVDVFQDVDIIFQKVKIDKEVQHERRVIPQNQIKAFLDTIPSDDKDLPMFTLFVSLGARISEFLGICVDCYDRENKVVIIKRQLLTSGKLTAQLKTGASYRRVPISDDTAKLLEEYLDNAQPQERLFDVSHRTFHRKLEYYENQAQIPHYTPHEFRHTRATMLASKCRDVSDVVYCAKLLGHSSSMFLNTYCHAMNDDRQKRFL